MKFFRNSAPNSRDYIRERPGSDIVMWLPKRRVAQVQRHQIKKGRKTDMEQARNFNHCLHSRPQSQMAVSVTTPLSWRATACVILLAALAAQWFFAGSLIRSVKSAASLSTTQISTPAGRLESSPTLLTANRTVSAAASPTSSTSVSQH